METLRSLARLDYPHHEIVVIDDNTDDETLWRPVEAWCRRHGVKFAHLEDWPGYKSGALNYALQEMTDPRAEVIGVTAGASAAGARRSLPQGRGWRSRPAA